MTRRIIIFLAALVLLTGAVGGGLAYWRYQYLLEKQDDLDRIPADAFAVVSIRIADYWKGSGGPHVRRALESIDPAALEKMQVELGLLPDDIERVTLVVPRYETWRENWHAYIITSKPLDAQKIFHAFGGTAEERKFEDTTYYLRNNLAYAFMSYRQVLLGTEAGLREALKTPAQPKGPLAEALGLVRRAKNHLVAGVHPPQDVLKTYRDGLPFFYRPASPLLEFRSATLVLDDLDGLELEGRVHFEDAGKAHGARDAFELVRLFAKGMIPEVRKMLPPEVPAEAGNILDSTGTSLGKLKLHVHGDAVHIPFHLPGQGNQLGAMIALWVPMVLR